MLVDECGPIVLWPIRSMRFTQARAGAGGQDVARMPQIVKVDADKTGQSEAYRLRVSAALGKSSSSGAPRGVLQASSGRSTEGCRGRPRWAAPPARTATLPTSSPE